MGCEKPVAFIHRDRLRSMISLLTQRAIREYGSGSTIGECRNRLGRSCRKPLVPFHQLMARLRTREMSRTDGRRTPVFSMNSTRCPSAASRDMISWWPCQMKSQSIDEMQRMSGRRSIQLYECNASV